MASQQAAFRKMGRVPFFRHRRRFLKLGIFAAASLVGLGNLAYATSPTPSTPGEVETALGNMITRRRLTIFGKCCEEKDKAHESLTKYARLLCCFDSCFGNYYNNERYESYCGPWTIACGIFGLCMPWCCCHCDTRPIKFRKAKWVGDGEPDWWGSFQAKWETKRNQYNMRNHAFHVDELKNEFTAFKEAEIKRQIRESIMKPDSPWMKSVEQEIIGREGEYYVPVDEIPTKILEEVNRSVDMAVNFKYNLAEKHVQLKTPEEAACCHWVCCGCCD